MNVPAVTAPGGLAAHREAIRGVLASYGVEAAGVFGSVARGQATDSSDLDLIVQFSPGVERDLIRLGEELSRVAGATVDVVDADVVRERAHRTGVGLSILAETVPL
ncbi:MULTISPECIES: nucleotidyltransferase family protein [unclassified Pseudactinotalea]|uniref:nucleotidyltransferase family protein n=1 Tax=unclassified Pseudactinotalea TaxID=2649176 RepID=UPI00128E8D8B|nr:MULTISPECIES: nucleotidyltransferase domain-containing protein [unclassified Pseudactinotalea]MPV50726.1 nucleotidyltransferase [Pseudactinotalea sp. HY160]QGH70086.1 nucleotidyltransferase [Pseudactinotalea sp. HY158]